MILEKTINFGIIEEKNEINLIEKEKSKKSQKRNLRINIYVTEEEKDKILNLSIKEGKKMSQYLRERALKEQITNSEMVNMFMDFMGKKIDTMFNNLITTEFRNIMEENGNKNISNDKNEIVKKKKIFNPPKLYIETAGMTEEQREKFIKKIEDTQKWASDSLKKELITESLLFLKNKENLEKLEIIQKINFNILRSHHKKEI